MLVGTAVQVDARWTGRKRVEIDPRVGFAGRHDVVHPHAVFRTPGPATSA